jgi:hypothetical protein
MTKDGVHLEVEIKNPNTKDALSQDQKEHGFGVLKHNSVYIVISSLDEIIKLYPYIRNRTTYLLTEWLAKEKIKS